MNRLLDFIERHKFGIIITFMMHLGLLLYMLVGTYKTILPDYEHVYWSEVIEEQDFVELKPEQILPPDPNQMVTGDIRNIARDANDQRERSNDNFSKSKADSKIEQSVKDLERQFFDEFKSSRIDGDGSKQSSTSGDTGKTAPKKDQNKSSTSNIENKTGTSTGGDKQYGGNVMVDFKVGDDRKPHNNNNWNVRNPGYTCGNDANGSVYISIRVNQNGNVVSAKYEVGMSSGANACMIDQALNYAKKSRFAYNSNNTGTEEGYIIYRFVTKR